MTSKAELNNNTPSIAQLQQVSSGELITAEVENANNLLNLNAIILAYNWIIDNGADLSLANIYTVAQEFSAGIKTNSIESLTTNANIVINNGTGVIYKNSVATNNKITTVADVAALITTGSDLTDGDKGDITVSSTGTVWTIKPSAVAATAAVTANTAKVTNATHTGDVTGATVLTLASAAITGKTSATPATGDSIVFSDVSDSGNLKKCLISELTAPTTDTTTYKTTSDQVIAFGGGIPVNITGLLFTPVANTTYLIKAAFRWVNSGATTGGGTFGHTTLSPLNYVFANGIINTTSGISGVTYEKLTDNSPRSFLSTGSAGGGEYQDIELIFRTGATVSGNFSITALPESSFGDLTISKGALMTVQVLAN